MASSENEVCRMYRNQFPEEGELVIARVESVTDICAHVSLIEYSNATGIVLLSNLSRKRIRSVAKHIRVGKCEYLRVLRVDQAKGYIDLTKKDVSKEDVLEFSENHKKTKIVHGIIMHLASETGLDMKDIYEMGIWDMYDTHHHALECFLKVIDDPSVLDEYRFTPSIKEQLKNIISTKFTAKTFRVQIDFELTCPSFNGIEGIKSALRAGLAHSTPDTPITSHLITTPVYMASVASTDFLKGKEILDKVTRSICREIRRQGGFYTVKTDARIVA